MEAPPTVRQDAQAAAAGLRVAQKRLRDQMVADSASAVGGTFARSYLRALGMDASQAAGPYGPVDMNSLPAKRRREYVGGDGA